MSTLGTAESIICHAALEGVRQQLYVLLEHRVFFSDNDNGLVRLNEEIIKVEERLKGLYEQGFDEWEGRCAEWNSDH